MQVVAPAADDQDGENDSSNQKEKLLPLSAHAVRRRGGLLLVLSRVLRLPLAGWRSDILPSDAIFGGGLDSLPELVLPREVWQPERAAVAELLGLPRERRGGLFAPRVERWITKWVRSQR